MPPPAPPPYEVKDTRPTIQLAMRIGLWVAVAFGCIGGVVGMVGGASGSAEPVQVQDQDTSGIVPAPVTNLAERATAAWLTASDDNEEDLEELDSMFLETPVLVPGTTSMVIGQPFVVSGFQWENGYWVMKVAVDVYECVPVESSDEDETEGDETEGDETEGDEDESQPQLPIDCEQVAQQRSEAREEAEDEGRSVEGPASDPDAPLEATVDTWFVQVGVVGDLTEGLAVMATPALVSPPSEPEGWAPTISELGDPHEDEPIDSTVENFLRDWLTGSSPEDLSRWVAPGNDVEPLSPAPFVETTLVAIGYDEIERGMARVRAQIEAVTPGGAQVNVSYELIVQHREDRWEVVDHGGAPALSTEEDDSSATEESGDE